ncbi:AraC family transcriptional regulator ligand-binding domain-containing protein [Zestomonas carbonaria]|uniref:HTH araC/xylS-type domain-containing protein n=1 Tax=Zestomonas carbonaria TaxID=2762745 RepID=A0A7U7EQE5_9GAMM|nr:AraC family transcriptional regulator ligand-binding domain-containing protein [Pseudomonas carbonaria]CAD5109278.1 hypothetical protein PSEWESI4_03574 [Pseudomonas carbonaria]
MRKSETITPPPRQPAQRFHRGPLGQMLERFLGIRKSKVTTDYSLTELELLWLEAAQKDPAIGLHIFQQFTPQDWHVLLYLALYCPDVLGAIQNWVRYAPLATDSDTVAMAEDRYGIAMEIRTEGPPALSRYLAEHYGVMAMTMLRRGTGEDIRPTLTHFTHARPSYHSEYTQWFGDKIEFCCSHTRFYFDTKTLGTPMRMRHTGMVELLTRELDRRIARHQQLSGCAAKVAKNVREMLSRGELPTLENQAEILHQSPRTLRRRLEDQDLTFRQLLDLVRQELEQHLELQGKSRAEIASKLGYNSLAAYQYARKRWKQE